MANIQDTGCLIFGVRLDHIPSRSGLVARFQSFLAGERTHSIFTPNPEILLRARVDPGYAALLNGADLLLPDGVGIPVVLSLRGRPRVRRWPGVDAAELILELGARGGAAVLLLGGEAGVAPAAAAHVRAMWPTLAVETAGGAMPFGEDGAAVSAEDEAGIVRLMRDVEPRVVLVGLGAPKQERWIDRHRASFPSVRIMMGIGGALDMWAGRFHRAPERLGSLGLEWLWRLSQQPSRLPRTLRATVLFPWYAFRDTTSG